MDSKKKKKELLDFEKPAIASDSQKNALQFQDEFESFSEQLECVLEVTAQVLSGEIELSPRSKNGLASMVYAISDQAKALEFRLSQLQEKPLQRFIQMVLRHDILIQYFDEKKVMLRIEDIWEDFPDMSERDRFLITFMLMVWNPPGHKYPKTKKFRFLSELQHLNEAEQQFILDWARDPFYVNDEKGRLIHTR